jgi:hypothetical protein
MTATQQALAQRPGTRWRDLLRRLLPSIGDFAWLIPIVFLFGRMNGARTLLGDGDTGWHIRTGEWILAHGRVPREDIFSFTRPGQPWFAWEWLSDIAMGWLHRTGGMQAVLLGAIVLICLTQALLYRLIRRKCGSVLIAFVLTWIAAAGSSIHWLARPHLFTMLFLIVFYSILEEKRMRLLFILPVAAVLWTNLHGGFLAGILLVGAYAGGELMSALLARGTEDLNAAAGRCWRYALAAFGCFAASFVNPWSWRLHAHLLRFLANPAYFQDIAEFASISFRHPLAPFFEMMMLLGMAAACQSFTQRRYVSFLLIAGWAHLALLSIRNIPLFMIVAAPPVGLALAEWLRASQKDTADTAVHRIFRGLDSLSRRLNAADAGPHWHITGPVVLLAVGAVMYGHAPSSHFQAEYDPHAWPVAALSTLRDSDRIFTSDTWGGYLIYRRFPSKVFVDGRSDFYGPEFEAKYNSVVGVRYNWEATLASFSVDTIVLSVDAPLSSALKGSPNWRAVYDDGLTIVFRTSLGNESLRKPPSVGCCLRTEPGHAPFSAVTHHETDSHKMITPCSTRKRPSSPRVRKQSLGFSSSSCPTLAS